MYVLSIKSNIFEKMRLRVDLESKIGKISKRGTRDNGSNKDPATMGEVPPVLNPRQSPGMR